MSRKASVKKGIFFGTINLICNLLFPFATRTIIIIVLGNAYVGLGSLFGSLLNILNISELGIGASLSFLLYKPFAENDKDKICAVLNFARKSFFVIGCVVAALGAIIMCFLKYLIASDIPDDINIYILYSITLLNSVISYMTFSYKRILFAADQRYDIEVNIASVCLFFQYALQIILLLIVKNYYVFVVVTVVATILNNVLCQIITKRKYSEYLPRGKMTKEDISFVKQKISGAFLAKLSSTIYFSVDNIIISVFFGLSILGKYNNYYLVIGALISAFAIIHNTLRPIIGNCIVNETEESNFERYLTFDFIYSWLSILCGTLLLALYQDFIHVWLGDDFLFGFNTVILLVVMFISERMASVTGIFIDAAGLWQKTKWVYLLAACSNLGFSILFAYFMEIDGVIIASIGTSFIITFIGTTVCLFKEYFKGVKKSTFFISTFLNYIIGGMMICGIYFLSSLYTATNWGFLILKGLCILIIFVTVFILMNFKRKQFKNSRTFFKGLIKREKS